MHNETSSAILIRRVLWLLLFGGVVGIFMLRSKVPAAAPAAPATQGSVMGTPVEVYTATASYVQSLATAKADQGGALLTQAASHLEVDLANQRSTQMAVRATQAAATEAYLLQEGRSSGVEFPPASSTQEAFFQQATQTAQAGALQSLHSTQTQAAMQAATAYPPTATALAITQAVVEMRMDENRSQIHWNQSMRGLFEYGLLGMLVLVTVGVVATYRQMMPVIVHHLDVDLTPVLVPAGSTANTIPSSAVVPRPSSLADDPAESFQDLPSASGPVPVIVVVEPEKVKAWLDEAEQHLLHPGGS